MNQHNNSISLDGNQNNVIAHLSTHMHGKFAGAYIGLFAFIGGFGQMYLNIDVPKGFIQKIGEAAITAGVSSVMGLIVKSIWLVTKRALVDYIRSFRKPNKSNPS